MSAFLEVRENRKPNHKVNGILLCTDGKEKDSRENSPGFSDSTKSAASAARKISFPADSIINAVIQDGDVQELLQILRHQRSEVDLNQANHVGLTALHHAVLTNNLDSVKLLLSYGADVRVQDVYGFSPLHTSAALGFVQITSLLIVFGADVFSMTKQKEMPVDVAKDISVIRILSNEMCLRVHQELLITAYVIMKCKRFWMYFYSFTRLVLSTVFRFVTVLGIGCVSYIRKWRNKPKLSKKVLLNSQTPISSEDKCVPGELKHFRETSDIRLSIKKKK